MRRNSKKWYFSGYPSIKIPCLFSYCVPDCQVHDRACKLRTTNLSSTCCISSSTIVCWLQKYFTENIKAIWTSSFKIRRKIHIKGQFSEFSFRLTSQTSLFLSCYVARYVSPKCVSVWLFTVETLSFSPEFFLHWGKHKFISLIPPQYIKVS